MGVGPHITIVGCGPGAPEFLTPAAVRAAEEAEVLVGARRLLGLFQDHPGEKIEMGPRTEEVLEAISRRPSRKIAVLVTGDPGIASLAGPVIRRFGTEHCRVIPGVSSLQAAFARLGMDWLDARLIDAHGQDPSLRPGDLDGVTKMAVLGGRPQSFAWLQRELGPRLNDFQVIICEDLTLPGERITTWEPETALDRPLSSRTIFILVRK
jgi:precorrin-6y C5,15-methyltransferase (decarboxylating) CbiE subunit